MEQGLGGARKRSADDDDDDNESVDTSNGSIALGSEDTDEDSNIVIGRMTSLKKAAKAPPGKPDKPGSPAPVNAPKEKMTDLEMLAHRMDKMTVNAASYGFNFNCPHPHYWWTFTITGLTYIKAEFLSWTVHHSEITCKISDDGTKLYVGTKLPERFVNILRQRGYYHEVGNAPDEGDVMLEQGRKAVSAINQGHSMEAIKPLTVLKLPFAVQEDFFDPYKPAEKGYALRSYPHELACQPGAPPANPGDPVVAGPPHSFFVIHVCMVSKSRAKVKTSMEYGHVNMTANDFGEV